MNFNTRWNIRDMFRNKARTVTGIIGVTACAMLIVCSLGMLNSMNYFIDLQYYNFLYIFIRIGSVRLLGVTVFEHT